MRKNLLFVIALFLSTYSYAQGETDAFKFSRTELNGTARGVAMGGAFGALGGDITGIAINPAGIGVYRTSELSTSLSLSSISNETKWENSINKNDKIRFNADNISYVGYYPIGNGHLQNVNFGFSYNKIKNFNRNYTAEGKKMQSSLTGYITYITNSFRDINGEGIHNKNDLESSDPYGGKSPWLSILGYRTYLMDPKEDNYSYSSVLHEGETVNPYLNVSEKGYIDSYDFSVGANFSNSFYLGMTLILTDVYYRMDSRYIENFGERGGFVFDNYLQTEGSGYQVNLGAIWRPIDLLRIGIAYHSPTWYVMKNFHQGIVDPDVPTETGERANIEKTPDGEFDYGFHTPYSWVFSIAGILGTKAIVSLDYEIKDYGSMSLKDQNGYDFQDHNKYISEDFRKASILRTGIEYRFTPQFSGRLGYAWLQNPYEKEFKNNNREVVIAGVVGTGTIPHYTIEGNVNYFTAGVGYRFTPRFYMDVAFVYKTQKDDLYYYPSAWDIEGNPIVSSKPASFKNTLYKGLVTLGYKF